MFSSVHHGVARRPRKGNAVRLSQLIALCILAQTDLAWSAPRQVAPVQANRWHILETANFRLMAYGRASVSQATGQSVEKLLATLQRQWLVDTPSQPWSPKCDIVLHATDADYLRAVGEGGKETLASSLVSHDGGRISLRRVDVRASRADWKQAALGHELTHVILSDRFAGRPLPRWLDEGMAMLADPGDKRARHQQDLRKALRQGGVFRLVELMTLDEYPATHRWPTFYGQSVSVVEHLIDQGGHQQFVAFVERSLTDGYDKALAQTYQLGLPELERRWQNAQQALLD